MENTLENKAKFFAQYFGQYVQWDITLPIIKNQRFDLVDLKVREDDTLVLKPLSAISDEDAEAVYNIALKDESHSRHYRLGKKDFIEQGRDLALSAEYYHNCRFTGLRYMSEVVDYLRSKAYLLPFNGLSCEELLNRGWTSLKTEVKNG